MSDTMATRISVSFPNEDEELLEWMEKKVDNREYRNKSEAVREGLRAIKEDDSTEYQI